MIRNKLFVFLLIFLGFTAKAFCDDFPVKNDITVFLKKNCVFRDPNPMWQPEADSINQLIVDILDGNKNQDTQNRMMQLYLENSVSVFEDMTDVMRYDHRRFLSLISIILYVDENKFRVFVGDTEDYLKSINEDYREKNELLLRLVYLYKLFETDELYIIEVKQQMDVINEILSDKESNDSFYNEYEILFQKIVSTIEEES